MNKALLLLFFISIGLVSAGQSASGYWYGTANVKSYNTTNNYLVELILNQERNTVKGVLNYFFRNSYRSVAVNGVYDAKTRELIIYDIPLTYHGSHNELEVDCKMTFYGKLLAAQAGSSLSGSFFSEPEYQYTCGEVSFQLALNAGPGSQDSVLHAIRNFKETHQLWKPTPTDTLEAVTVLQRRVINYVVDREFRDRETVFSQDLEVESDSITVDFYDNGEVDGDSISIFFNDELLSFNRRLSTRPVHFKLGVDTTLEYNTIAMFADNLGSIPPNTALMIVHDGKKRYQIRLTSSLDQNAAIRVRRKKY